MHPRNVHKNGYDFKALCKANPSLSKWVIVNPIGKATIDFSAPEAVKMLNAALLKCHYHIAHWDIPKGYLCPPVPGRADYIHFIADLLAQDNDGVIPRGKNVMGLDIGTGANLIYPIVGVRAYDWQFVGCDIDNVAIASAKLIAKSNMNLEQNLKIRQQQDGTNVFQGIIGLNEKFAFSMCNPPFHSSAKAAQQGTQRKNANLHRHKHKTSDSVRGRHNPLSSKDRNALNFAGQTNELWCPGGEVGFIKRMISESSLFRHQVGWFTSLVSKKGSLRPLYKALEKTDVNAVKTVDMGQGNKVSRFIAWRY